MCIHIIHHEPPAIFDWKRRLALILSRQYEREGRIAIYSRNPQFFLMLSETCVIAACCCKTSHTTDSSYPVGIGDLMIRIPRVCTSFAEAPLQQGCRARFCESTLCLIFYVLLPIFVVLCTWALNESWPTQGKAPMVEIKTSTQHGASGVLEM